MGRPAVFKLSIVIPAFNEQECVGPLLEELRQVLANLTPDYEVIFVDDCSRDQTFFVIEEESFKDDRIKCLRFSRNMGHQVALAAGLEMSRGDVVISMDADLQHPPAMIPQMIDLWKQGFDAVNTVKRRTESATLWEKVFSKIFYRVFNAISEIKIIPNSSDFRLLDRCCVNALVSMREYSKFFRGMVPFVGYRQTILELDCPPRHAGERSYTLWKSLKLAMDGVFSFSTVGLKIPLFLGMGTIAITLLYFAVSAVFLVTGHDHYVHGWPSIIALITMSIGLQLSFIGIFGVYLSKIFNEVKGRPLYFVSQSIGFHSPNVRPLPRGTFRELDS